MAKTKGKRGAVSLLRRAASSLAGALTRRRSKPESAASATTTRPSGNGSAQQARPARRRPDVPLDQIEQEYTPTQTSLKSGFRASGEDRERDQEYTYSERFNDEDHYTNRSGDPRIGTHGRTYEPGEKGE